MDPAALDRFRCPTCRAALSLRAFAGAPEPDGVVKDGVLLCETCRAWYPIGAYVPVLLDFPTRFHDAFAERHAGELRALAGYRPPKGAPRPGESSVQETFTDEWDTVQGDDELSFIYSMEDLERLNREVWLRWLGDGAARPRRVLEVGCGLGSETLALREVVGEAELFAVDLNLALLQRGEAFHDRRDTHLAVASAFALPFEPSAFDLVYSQGVIHHTFSTQKALEAISSHVREGGHCFVWVYGLDDHLVHRGLAGTWKRVAWVLEHSVRPLISRAPKPLRDAIFGALTALAHPFVRARMRHRATWGRANTEHTLRDWLSPRYAHRHSYNELFEWFEQLGFEVVDTQSPAAYRRLFEKPLWGVGLTARKR
jgi:SAM-dependent methyltransferase/uncharacterized protein YbaR (Trm112 family)